MASAGWRKNDGGPGRCQRGADFLADDARLAEAHRHDSSVGGVDRFHDIDERVVEVVDEPEDCRRFNFQHPPGLGERGVDLGITNHGSLPRLGHRGVMVCDAERGVIPGGTKRSAGAPLR